VSYILDALKKSEQERKSGGVPTLQTVHIPVTVEDRKPWNLYGVISVLLLALAFVVGFVVSEKEGVESIERDAIVSEQVEKIEQKTVNTPTTAVKIQPEIPAGASADASASAPPESVVQKKSVEVAKVDAPVAAQALQPAIKNKPVAVIAQPKAKPVIPILEDIAFLHELPDYLQQSIPDLSFAGHVYSSSSANRSVIINGRAMSEGDSIMREFVVRKITASGVIFVFQGTPFRVDILQDWSFE